MKSPQRIIELFDLIFFSTKATNKFNQSNFIKFATRKNKLTNLTEFYDLIYEYKNYCLTASIVYNKEYYSNKDLEPNETLMFNITVIPFETFTSKNIKN